MPGTVLAPPPEPARTRVSPRQIADAAVAALHAEAELTPKPGLVDRRGGGAHADMNLELLTASAEALREAFEQCADAATRMPPGPELRARIGAVGRDGERRMLAATGGVNTHRGALWALGLLSAGAARAGSIDAAAEFAACLARLPDHGAPRREQDSHGEQAHVRFGAAGAAGEARAGFPHVTGHVLPALYRARSRGAGERSARLDALLAVMASLQDTCLLHRGGPAGLAAVQRAAAGVLAVGGSTTPDGARRLAALDDLARTRRLSPGGSADLLSAALFLDSLPFAQGRIRHADADLSVSR